MTSRFVFALLAAAAAIQATQAQIIESSDKEDITGMPRVVFFRPPVRIMGRAVPFEISCDLTKVAKLRNKTYFEVALSPGLHSCSVADLPLVDPSSNFVKLELPPLGATLELEAKPGPKQWVIVRYQKTNWRTVVLRLALADPVEAQEEVQRKRIRPLDPRDQAIRSIRRTPAGSASK